MTNAAKCALNGTIVTGAILLTTHGALAQTTIDSSAKPYFIAGGAIVTAFFISVGVMLVLKGNRYFRIAAAMAQWPTVTGKVIYTDVITRIEKTEDGPSKLFIPQVHYVYESDGVRRDGRVIKFGLDQHGYRVEKLAHDHVARYAVGATVPVRYDPQNPADGILEIGQIGGGGYVFAGSLLIILGLGGLAFTIFSIITPSS